MKCSDRKKFAMKSKHYCCPICGPIIHLIPKVKPKQQQQPQQQQQQPSNATTTTPTKEISRFQKEIAELQRLQAISHPKQEEAVDEVEHQEIENGINQDDEATVTTEGIDQNATTTTTITTTTNSTTVSVDVFDADHKQTLLQQHETNGTTIKENDKVNEDTSNVIGLTNIDEGKVDQQQTASSSWSETKKVTTRPTEEDNKNIIDNHDDGNDMMAPVMDINRDDQNDTIPIIPSFATRCLDPFLQWTIILLSIVCCILFHKIQMLVFDIHQLYSIHES
jgi:hypothetical protein